MFTVLRTVFRRPTLGMYVHHFLASMYIFSVVVGFLWRAKTNFGCEHAERGVREFISRLSPDSRALSRVGLSGVLRLRWMGNYICCRQKMPEAALEVPEAASVLTGSGSMRGLRVIKLPSRLHWVGRQPKFEIYKNPSTETRRPGTH